MGLSSFRNGAVSLLASASMGLAACASDGSLSPQGRQIIGGLIGGLVGYAACRAANANDTQCALLVLGGAAAGVLIARHIDARDRPHRDQAVARFLDQGQQTASWENAETTSRGSLQLLATTTDAQGRECRQVQEEYTNGQTGQVVPETYTMCKSGERWVTQT